MKIYFVRHGSTESFERRITQSATEPLNERGLSQARELAKRFSKTPLDLIISSPFTRARQTAQAISDKITISDLFKEVIKPTEVVGRSKEDQDVKDIMRKIGEMYFVDPLWHYSDEENFEDLKKRGVGALEFLKSQNAENILVVSHGNFIALMIGIMFFGKDFSVDISLRFKNFLRLANTGVSICSYEPQKDRWQLECWNDTSHCLE